MTTVLLILLLAGVLGLFGALLLLGRRLQRLEAGQDRIAGSGGLGERLEALAAGLEQLRQKPQRLETPPLQAGIAELRAAMERLEQSLLEGAPASPSSPEGPVRTRPERVAGAVRERLRREGYDSVKLLTSYGDLLGDPVTVRLEAYRNGLLMKGMVKVEGEEVVEEKLLSALKMFP